MNGKDQLFDARGVAQNYLSIKERVWLAAQKCGRDPASVQLVAVTKTFDAAHIRPVLDEGHRSFGENRVQEAKAKWPELVAETMGIELHLIGPLQTNKTHEALSLFHVIHTLDRPKLAASLADEIQKTGRAPKLLVQVNTGLEPQKAGVIPDELEGFVASCHKDYHLEISGLMCIPPVDKDPAPHFQTLASWSKRLGLVDLSMGMSGDYETAIAHGATMVRVGSAIFGAR